MEQVEHLFVHCPFARSVWQAVKEEFSFALGPERACQ
jgi:hypothetical protein